MSSTKYMEDAQNEFQKTVRDELDRLVREENMSLNEAAQNIMGRISDRIPSGEEVTQLSRRLCISTDDAYRAIVVRDEIRNLKKSGADTIAAVNTLRNRIHGSMNLKKRSRASLGTGTVGVPPTALLVKRIKPSEYSEDGTGEVSNPSQSAKNEFVIENHPNVSMGNTQHAPTKPEATKSILTPSGQARKPKRKFGGNNTENSTQALSKRKR